LPDAAKKADHRRDRGGLTEEQTARIEEYITK
jgi:hypothetical protein